MAIKVDIEKRFSGFTLRSQFEAGDEVVALLGASGCGKSLTLKCIAGIEKPDRGHIEVDGVTLFDSEQRINLSPQERRTGLLFQNYALFPNMTVLGNLRCGARRESKRAKREQSVEAILRSFGLEALRDRYPHQLSGGQQQRVALARILVSSPRILLLDEPFSALDSHLRFRLEQEVRDIAVDFGKTVILVSHDRDEVYRLSDKIAVMADGRVEVCGERERVFRDPRTVNAAILTGCKNIVPCSPLSPGLCEVPGWGLRLALNETGRPYDHIGIRMHDVAPGDGENAMDVRVRTVIKKPFSYAVMLEPLGGTLGLGMELTHQEWESIQAERLRVHLPRRSILILHEGAETI